MGGYTFYEYLNIGDSRLFTMVALPSENGKFPVVVCRSPYVENTVNKSEKELTQDFLLSYSNFIKRGYAIVYQHCKGCGKSTGSFVPYIHEREDGLALREWIRGREFYNGELFLLGGSYTASLHYATAPFEADIKGAIFEVQDSERYNLWYRNGQMRKGHANWYFGLYKSKKPAEKNFSMRFFSELPLENLSERALGERAEDFEKMLAARFPFHEFWRTRYGGHDARDALVNADIPILLTTGYNDFYVGGIFKMWDKMDCKTKSKSALIVSPYNHGDSYDRNRSIAFPMGKRTEQFGEQYDIDWFDHIRKGNNINHRKGVITYYRTFENRWESDFYKKRTELIKVSIGNETLSFDYDPLAPTAFASEGCLANENEGKGLIRICTKPLEKDVFVKGQMRAVLAVSSTCPDTSFYVRISIKKREYTYVLRHDITSLSYQLGSYQVNNVVNLKFSFDEHAFLLDKGECLQVDIAATDDNAYVSHTNNTGEYYLQSGVTTAVNTVYLKDSYLLLPVEAAN